MNKREFLKLSSALVAGAAINPLEACRPKPDQAAPPTPTQPSTTMIKNWAGNFTFSTGNIHEPGTVDEVVELIKKYPKLRALGTRHCFNRIADSDQNLISSRGLKSIGEIDTKGSSITVGAGVRYGDLCKVLHEKGYAIHNLASLPHISVAGAIATATHGSGVKNGNLSTSVKAIEFVNGKGEIIRLSKDKDGDAFNGAVVHLGCLGVLTSVTLQLVPTFNVGQLVYLNLPFNQLEKNFKVIMSSAYSVSLFYDWQTDKINQVWVKDIAKGKDNLQPVKDFYGAQAADKDVHPIIEVSAENCTAQMGIPGPWYDRLPHFKLDFTPSNGEELQAEYFVPFDQAVDTIRSVRSLKDELRDLILITEIRTIAADELWMSMSYRRPSVAIHFTLKQNIEGVTQFLPKLEARLAPFAPRPHWGKLFSIEPAELLTRYEKITAFKALVAEHDPDGKFQNDFIVSNLYPGT